MTSINKYEKKIIYPLGNNLNIKTNFTNNPTYKLVYKRSGKKFKIMNNKTKDFYFCNKNKIGKGRFGEIYNYDKKNKLAIKLNIDDNELLNEIQSINNKNNKNENLLKIFEYWNCLEGEKNFLVMELCNNDLFNFINDNTFIERYKNSDILLNNILNGLNELNDYNTIAKVHHDLKPENILFDIKKNYNCFNGGNEMKYIFKICDYGCVKKLHDQLDNNLGTYSYLPPEIHLYYNKDCSKDYNILTSHPSIDYYSIGVIYYTLITKELFISDKELSNIKYSENPEKEWEQILLERIKKFRKKLEYNKLDENNINKSINIISCLLSFHPRERINFLKMNYNLKYDYKLKILKNLDNLDKIELWEPDTKNIEWFHKTCKQVLEKILR